MQQTMINHPKLKVRQSTGREGPAYDPYGYVEYEVETPEGVVVVHDGLDRFALIGDQKIRPKGDDWENAKWTSRVLREYTGYSLEQIERIHNRLTSRCSKGGYHDTDYYDGYPGEEFEVCRKCGKTIRSTFNINAVL